jgi:Zn-dependent peptidase ImmA (M78 family)
MPTKATEQRLVITIGSIGPKPAPKFTKDLKPQIEEWLKEAGENPALLRKELRFEPVRTFPIPLDQVGEHAVYVYYATKAAYKVFDQIILPRLKKLCLVKNKTKAVETAEKNAATKEKETAKPKPKAKTKPRGGT